jgi:hypothetical protein
VDPSSTSNNQSAVVKIAAFLERIDRRWLYGAMIGGIVLALLFSSGVTVKVTPPVLGFHASLESLQPASGKIVVVAMDFDPQTKAENYPQAQATVRHLLKNKIPFAVVTTTAMGAGFCEEIPNELAGEFGAVYGKDWVNWGYKYGVGIFIKTLAGNIPDAIETDANGTPIEQIECMKGVKDASSVQVLCEFTGLVGMLEAWLQFFQKSGVRPDVVHGCTAVSGPSNYAFLDSGQLSGLLVGMLGAAEYEQMLDTVGGGLKGMSAQTIAHILIIVFIIVGNLAELIRRQGERAARAGGTA